MFKVYLHYLFPSRLRVAVNVRVAYHSDLVQHCARGIASGSQASARQGLPAWVRTVTENQLVLAQVVTCQPLGLAPLAQAAILSILRILGILSILRTLTTLMQLTGLGQAGAGGEGVARPVVGEAQGQGIASAPHPQLGACHVMDQPMRERPVSLNLV